MECSTHTSDSEQIIALDPTGAHRPLDSAVIAELRNSPSDTRTANNVARLINARGLPGRLGGPLVWAWLVASPILAVSAFGALGSGDAEAFWGFLGAFLTARALVSVSQRSSDQRAALLLHDLDGEWLDPLIDALAYPSRSVQSIARLRLTTLLPTLDASAADGLSPGRRAQLFDFLTPWHSATQPDLVCAILEFGSITGDEQAHAGTEALAEMRAFTSAQRRVRANARRCLARLEQKLAEQIARETTADMDHARSLRELDQRPALSSTAQEWLNDLDAGSARQPAMRFAFLLAAWGVILPYAIYQTVAQYLAGSRLFAIAALGAIVSTQLHRFTLTPAQARLASKIAGIEDVQAVGPLAEMTIWPDERIRFMALSALARLLPRLRASDTQLLSASQRALLYPFLTLSQSRRHAELQIALLTALEQVGDQAALPYVRALAAESARTPRQRRVVEAARGCLPYLEDCAEQNRQSQILLRPITEDPNGPNLLRPAAHSEVDTERLLRLAVPPESL